MRQNHAPTDSPTENGAPINGAPGNGAGSPVAGSPKSDVQRISKTRRDYNQWVADETLEDYALRYTPNRFRKWSVARVANTAFGAASFLALEAIGATVTLSYGFANAAMAILAISLMIFLTGIPIAYQAARNGLDMDLLGRGAGFGYLGSTITSLIYACFTLIFFALEAAIMAHALKLWTGLPLVAGYLVSAMVVIPMVAHGVTFLSRLQMWTQPAWIILLITPYLAVLIQEPTFFADFVTLNGRMDGGEELNWVGFGAACTVIAALIAQIGEQVDFLRFMPEPAKGKRWRWWLALIAAGPGWIIPGALKMFGGALLAFIALQHELSPARAVEPTQMYLLAYQYLVGPGAPAIALTAIFVIVSQVKINVTNAYAGSLAWSNFFARLTHTHPGRVVWLLFNVGIASLLMLMGLFEVLERVLSVYSHLAVAWIGAIVGDLLISKPLGISPARIEFRRAYLYDINPAGFGAMVIGAVVSVLAYFGMLGTALQPASTFLALGVAALLSPLIAKLSRSQFFLARTPLTGSDNGDQIRCVICDNDFEAPDMANCPAYDGAICSLCCTLDTRCEDRCKPEVEFLSRLSAKLSTRLSRYVSAESLRLIFQHMLVACLLLGAVGTMLWMLYSQESTRLSAMGLSTDGLGALTTKVFIGLLLISAIGLWWLILSSESRLVAQQEAERQNQLLGQEISAHKLTDQKLQAAKETAESANLAKTRFLTGLSHEMRSPLNSIMGFAELLVADKALPTESRQAVDTIYRSGDHLASLVDGLMELSRIEAGKLRLESRPLPLLGFLSDTVRMFEPEAQRIGLDFRFEKTGDFPNFVRVDAKRLRQVIINLVSNAIKFTEKGHVLVRTSYAREMLNFEVIDSGPGISADDIERIFDPFERVGDKVEGVGLGLTITQLLLELMGGTIAVDSSAGRGSRFACRIYAPALSDAAVPDRVQVATGYAGPMKSVLIVDDTADHRLLMKRMLSPLGFATQEANSVAVAREKLSSASFDLVLLDLNLPDGYGWEVFDVIEAMPASPAVLVVSANAYQNTETLSTKKQVRGYVVKPVRYTDLLNNVAEATGLTWQYAESSDALLFATLKKSLDPGELRELLELSASGYKTAFAGLLNEIATEKPSLETLLQRLRELGSSDPGLLQRTLIEALNDKP